MDGLIAVSEAVRDHYSEHLNLPSVEVIYNGVSSHDLRPLEEPEPAAVRIRYGLPAGDTILLCAGRFRQEKGHAYALAALSELRTLGLRPCLVLAGRGPLEDVITADIRRRGLQDQVRMVGHLSHSDLMEMMVAANIVIMPSLQEGLGVTAIEASMLGKPVVASRAGGLPEVVADGVSGLLVPPRDSPALARYIQRLIANPSFAADLGRNAKTRASRLFTIETTATRHEQLFEASLMKASMRRSAH